MSAEHINRWSVIFAQRHLLTDRAEHVEQLIRSFLESHPDLTSPTATLEDAFDGVRRMIFTALGEPIETVTSHLRGILKAERIATQAEVTPAPEPARTGPFELHRTETPALAIGTFAKASRRRAMDPDLRP